jgi:hypothetical protein
MDVDFDNPSLADPYGGVVLGVECAWPSREWQAAEQDGAPAWDAHDTRQYTVSTGTPNR